jgi:restriction endonuclease S subunit
MGRAKPKEMKIEELVMIQPGYQHKGQMTNDPNGDLACIQVQDLDYDSKSVKGDGIWKIRAPKDLSHYKISSGDILYLSRGSRYGAYRIPEVSDDTIPLSHFLILRLKTDAPTSITYLWWALNEQKVSNQIKNQMRGTMMPFIGRSEFAEIKIPIPEKSLQERIVEFSILRNQERSLVNKLERAKDRLFDALLEKQIYDC